MSTPTTTKPAEQLPANTVAVFATLCGATVAVTKEAGDSDFHAWVCLGCTEYGFPRHKDYVIPDANTHAGTCRSMPLPA
jgi:hypothetical protein